MKEKSIIIYKYEGETPLQCLDRFRTENPLYADATLSYIGRLDPMAEGQLLVVVDEENKNREEYLKLNKTYEVDVLLGIQTDTGDILGKIIKTDVKKENSNIVIYQSFLNSFIGDITLSYPQYSSKPVDGKSLFEWARMKDEGKEIPTIVLPQKTTHIHSLTLLDTYSLASEEILKLVKERIQKVKGDFRQEEIIAKWAETLSQISAETQFNLISIEVVCSSGTYMRSLAEFLATKIDTIALAWKIKRTHIDLV